MDFLCKMLGHFYTHFGTLMLCRKLQRFTYIIRPAITASYTAAQLNRFTTFVKLNWADLLNQSVNFDEIIFI